MGCIRTGTKVADCFELLKYLVIYIVLIKYMNCVYWTKLF